MRSCANMVKVRRWDGSGDDKRGRIPEHSADSEVG